MSVLGFQKSYGIFWVLRICGKVSQVCRGGEGRGVGVKELRVSATGPE